MIYLHALPRSVESMRQRAATLLRQYREARSECNSFLNHPFPTLTPAENERYALQTMKRALRCQGEYIMFRNML